MFYLLFTVLLFFAFCDGKAVAIVGGGIGGGAVAYFGHRNDSTFAPTMFEARNYIGGRLKHMTFDGVTVELGGDAWAAVNEYMVEVVAQLNIPLTNGSSSGRLGVWSGKKWEHVGTDFAEHVFSDTRVVESLTACLERLRSNYRYRDARGVPFPTIPDFLAPGGMREYTNVSSAEFYKQHKVSSITQSFLIVPVTRTIYDQEMEIHAFASQVSLAALLRAYSARDGNSVIVEAMHANAGTEVRLSTHVTAIAAKQGGGYLVTFRNSSGVFTRPFDAVALAAPFEFLNISFSGVTLPTIPPRQFVLWFVTHVLADSVNPKYFNMPDNAVVPDNILTTHSASANTPWACVQYVDTGRSGKKIYKLFSNTDVSGILSTLFVGATQTDVQHWPYTFPILHPLQIADFQPIVLAPGLFYLNGMESVASAMEGSVIAGRNVAALITSHSSENPWG